MKKLKVVSLIMALSILLSGCKLNNPEDLQDTQPTEPELETVTLRVWGGQHDQELLTQMIETFKEEYKDEAQFDITLEVVNEGVCKSTILENINEAADVFSFADDQLIELAASGILAPIDSPENIINDNVKGSVDAGSINGTLYAHPLTADNGYFMFYNKSYFQDKDLESLDDMLQLAATQNKQITFDLGNSWYLYSFFGNTGLKVGLNDDDLTNYCDWNSTTAPITGLDVCNSLLNITSSPAFLPGGDDVLIDGVTNDTVIAGVSGVWLASVLQKLWGDNFAATKLPTYKCGGKDIQMSSYAGYKLISSNAYSPNKVWADKLAMWLSNPQNQLLRFRLRGNGPSNKEIATSQEVNDSPQIKALIMQSEYASLQRVGAKYWVPSADFGGKMIRGEISSENMQAALDEMVEGIKAPVTE